MPSGSPAKAGAQPATVTPAKPVLSGAEGAGAQLLNGTPAKAGAEDLTKDSKPKPRRARKAAATEVEAAE